MVRIRPSPRKKILGFFKYMQPTEPFTRSEIAERFGITYWSARYWLDKLAEEKFVRKEVIRVDKRRRVFYYRVIVAVYYRTQYAIMFYTEEPRVKSPDPIAEFRVTAVSNRKGQYDLKEFEKACIYIGVILAPQTYWIKQEMWITADELDEPIDVDELQYSVHVKKKLGYAERYAVFFRSRRGVEAWREAHPYWWVDPKSTLPAPRSGDYEYDETFIKGNEERLITLRKLKLRFDNEKGRMEDVEV